MTQSWSAPELAQSSDGTGIAQSTVFHDACMLAQRAAQSRKSQQDRMPLEIRPRSSTGGPLHICLEHSLADQQTPATQVGYRHVDYSSELRASGFPDDLRDAVKRYLATKEVDDEDPGKAGCAMERPEKDGAEDASSKRVHEEAPHTSNVRASFSSKALPAGDQLGAGETEMPMENCLRRLLQSGGIPHDVRLIADDGELRSHRYILIRRSHFFARRLQGFAPLEPWEPIPQLRIDGVRVDTLQQVLVYLYTDKCDFELPLLNRSDIERCVELSDVAIRFGLQGLETLLHRQVLGPLALAIPECIQHRAQLRHLPERTADELAEGKRQ